MSVDHHKPIGFEGVVLRTFPSRESDMMLRVLTRSHGKVSVLAKYSRGSKKHFGGGVDLFDIGNFELTYGRGPTPLLKSFRCTTRLSSIRTDLDKIALCSLLSETADNLSIEDGPEGEDFDLLREALLEIEESKSLKDQLSAAYQGLVKLMQCSGFLDERFEGRGSTKKLAELMDSIESIGEKKLESRSSVLQILARIT